MNTPTVTWRQTVAAAVAVVVALVGVVVLFSSDGLPAVNASASPATRWFVHRPTGYVVLVDGYGGRALARMDAESDGDQISVTEGGAVAYLLNDTTAEVTPIETADLRFGAPVELTALGDGRAVVGVGPAGLTVVNPVDGQASTLPLVGEPLDFEVDFASPPVIAPDGVGVDHRRPGPAADELDVVVGRRPRPRRRSDAVARRRTNRSCSTRRIGGRASVMVRGSSSTPTRTRARSSARSVGRPGRAVGSERTTTCGAWRSTASPSGPPSTDSTSTVPIRSPSPATPVWSCGVRHPRWCGSTGAAQRLLDDRPMSVAPDADLEVTSTVDLVWVDDVAGDLVWAVNPWEINAIEKDGAGTFEVGEDGTLIEEGDVGDSTTPTPDDPAAGQVIPRHAGRQRCRRPASRRRRPGHRPFRFVGPGAGHRERLRPRR